MPKNFYHMLPDQLPALQLFLYRSACRKGIALRSRKGNHLRRQRRAKGNRWTTCSNTQQHTLSRRKNSNDIHSGRKKDPPELYFKSGLEYFKNHDFNNAYKNFTYADSVDPQPRYMLWKGKALRQLDRDDQMLFTMQQIIKHYGDSDVADDALLEIALYYQSNDDYEKASQFYTRLIEQYPFGVSFSTGEELREVAGEQRRLMRAEIINLLSFLGYSGDDLNSSYSKFQKANKLEITGTGNSQTIKAIRRMHNVRIEKDEQKVLNAKEAERYSLWNIIAVSLGSIIIILLIVLRLKTRAAYKHVNELSDTLKDLDTNKL